MLVMGLVFGEGLMLMGGHCCCLHVNYIVYKHFDKSGHQTLLMYNFSDVCLLWFLRYRDSN